MGDHTTYLVNTGFLTSGKIVSNAQLRLFLNRHFRSYALLRRLFTITSKKALFASSITNTAESQSSLKDKYAITLKEFKAIEDDCEKNQIPCWFLLIPPKEFVYDNDVLQSQWKSFCALLDKNNIKYLDCLSALKEGLFKRKSIFFKVDPHLDENGHKIIAEEIYKYLSSKLSQENNN